MTDAELDTLAKEILTFVVARLLSLDNDLLDAEVRAMADGELVVSYSGQHAEGYGGFICQFISLEPIKKILIECERAFNDSPKIEPPAKSDDSARLASIQKMAEIATTHLLGSFRTRIGHMLVEAVEDCNLIAKSALSGVIAGHFTETADIRLDIESAADRVAERKRIWLRKHVSSLPNTLSERGRGRIPKSDAEREQDRAEYDEKVKQAYRYLRLKLGKKPKKKQVAQALGEGGINPKTFKDSSLQSFRAKLDRLGVDYDKIALGVESELNNKS